MNEKKVNGSEKKTGRIQLVEALEQIKNSTTDETIKERLTKWMVDYQALSEGSLRILLNDKKSGKGKTSGILTDGLEDLTIEEPLNFDYCMETETNRWGSTEQVINFNKIESTNKEMPLEINLKKKKKAIRIDYKTDQDKVPPFALLLPKDITGTAQLKEPIFNTKRKRWELTFNNLTAKEYLLVFEPGRMTQDEPPFSNN